MSKKMDIYTELDNFVEENEGQVTLTDVAKHFADYAHQYAVDKAYELIEKLCDSHNIVSIKDGKYKNRSWLEEEFRKAMKD